MDNVFEMVPKTIHAKRLREKINNYKTKAVAFGVATLELAEEFYQARCEFDSNNDFHHWLVDNELDDFGHQDRAALINLGEHIELLRQVLEETDRQSFQLIWEKEIRPRLTNASKTTSPESEPEKPQESTEKSEEKSEEPKEKEEKSEQKSEREEKSNKYHGSLARFPKSDLVVSYILDPRMRSVLAGIIHNRKSPIWDLLVEAIEIGAFGNPIKTQYASLPNLRLVLPWCPSVYAKKYDLTKSADRTQVIQDVFPVAVKYKSDLAENPERLPVLVQELYRTRQQEREEKRREESISKMPRGEQKIVAFGETIWPRINDAPFTYEELCLAIWFFNFTITQFPVQWDAKSKALQMQQMLKWLTPVCKFSNWPTAVRKLCAAYSVNPDGLCEFPPPPANFGIS